MKQKKRIEKKIDVRQLDGSFKRKSVYAFSTQELNAKIQQIQDEAEQQYIKHCKPKFKDIALDWNDIHESEVAHYTYQGYQAPLKQLIEEFGDCCIDEITTADLQSFINRLHNQGYAKQTINLRKIVGKLIFDYALSLSQTNITINPAIYIKLPRNARKSKRELPSEEEIQKVIASVNKPFGLFAFLIYYTGCRREEALALKYDDIDFHNDLISINKVVVFHSNIPHIEHRAKTANGVRCIPLLDPLKKELFGCRNKKGYIFTNENGDLLHLGEFIRAYDSYREKTGITATPHQFRHAFATICYDAGLLDKDAADIMGHSKVELTRNIYTHITESRRKTYIDKLNKFVS